MKNIARQKVLLLIVFSYFFFILGNSVIALTNPDEVFYAQTAKEMVKHASWMTPYLFDQPQFEKPILTYWLLRIGFILFGSTNFAARLFPAVFAGIGVIAVYLLGLRGFKDEKKAFLASIILMSSAFYVGLARTVFTDLIFSVFILLALASFYAGYAEPKRKSPGIVFFFVFSGLAVLTKGPLGLFIPLLVIVFFLALRKETKFLLNVYTLWGACIFLAIAMPWYGFADKHYGNDFVREFFYNDHIRRLLYAEHKSFDKWYFYPLSITGCLFPWSLMVAASFTRFPGYFKRKANVFSQFLACWITSVLVVFQFAHSKLASYIVPMYPALALVAAGYLYDLATQKKTIRILKGIAWGNVCLFALAVVGLVFGQKHFEQYLSSPVPLYCLIAVFSVLALAMAVCIARNKVKASFYLLALLIPLVLASVPLAKEEIELQASSKPACEYLMKNYAVTNTILCSKPFVRGVRFYTDRPVAVLDMGGKQFFSPHPVPFLDTRIKAVDFLRTQGATYGVLKKASFGDLQRIAGNDFQWQELRKVGNEYIVKITALGK